MRRPSVLLAGAALCALAGCTTAAKQDLSAAYESCKGKTGEARNLCIEGERERFAVERERAYQACRDEIAEQEDRRAMIKGRRTGDPSTEAASGACGAAIAQ